jgi:cellulose 1,4-beta-cellobiosidase
VTFGSTGSTGKIACTNTITGSNSIALDSGAYYLQGDEWDSSEPFTLCNDGGEDFSITTSGIDNTGGAPGAYPDIYKGCNWGNCTKSSGMPILVSTITATPNTVTSSYNTSVVSGTWDDSYDIWYNSGTSTSNNETNGLEMMIWIDHEGGVQPIGKVVASNVVIDGYSFDVWYGPSSSTYGTVSYVMNTPTTSVSNIDLGQFAADSVSRGYMKSTFYLLDVPVGFETWANAQGLTVNSFSVNVQ